MLIKDMVNEAFQTACEKGWHEESLTIADGLAGENERQLANAQFCTRVALIHSEASEVLEAFRVRGDVDASQDPETGKPEGVPSELADIVIRIGDLCGLYGIDLKSAFQRDYEAEFTPAGTPRCPVCDKPPATVRELEEYAHLRYRPTAELSSWPSCMDREHWPSDDDFVDPECKRWVHGEAQARKCADELEARVAAFFARSEHEGHEAVRHVPPKPHDMPDEGAMGWPERPGGTFGDVSDRWGDYYDTKRHLETAKPELPPMLDDFDLLPDVPGADCRPKP